VIAIAKGTGCTLNLLRASLLHNPDLLIGQAVEVVDELINLVVGGGDLALEAGLLMFGLGGGGGVHLVPLVDSRLYRMSRPFLRRAPEAIEPSNHTYAHVLPCSHYETLFLAETIQTRP